MPILTAMGSMATSSFSSLPEATIAGMAADLSPITSCVSPRTEEEGNFNDGPQISNSSSTPGFWADLEIRDQMMSTLVRDAGGQNYSWNQGIIMPGEEGAGRRRGRNPMFPMPIASSSLPQACLGPAIFPRPDPPSHKIYLPQQPIPPLNHHQIPFPSSLMGEL